MKTVNLLNTSIHNISLQELLEKLTNQGGFVVTPNVDHLVKLQKDQELVNAYQEADYRVCDSKIVEKTCALLGTPIKEKISGSDLFPAFYEYNKDNEDVKIFLLGGQTGIPEQAKNNINTKVGRKIIIDALSPSFGFEKDEAECLAIVERINQSGATVLAVGVGAPKQEKWIAKYRHLLPKVKTFLAIGATIDFEAGNKPRAPKWMSNNGLEWFYRLASEPKRLWKRYLIESLPFFNLVLQQKIQVSFASKSISQSDLTIQGQSI
jgi:exopolysaccharide biosynthesis WecB/TagA/CpsF family protein